MERRAAAATRRLGMQLVHRGQLAVQVPRLAAKTSANDAHQALQQPNTAPIAYSVARQEQLEMIWREIPARESRMHRTLCQTLSAVFRGEVLLPAAPLVEGRR
eukprot:2057233-Pleurochrysis_carterae.AAC.1